ncbi:PREDICTED: uncharacterized protein LOC107067473 [Polistes dominula]|uniref:Uncharacterized protein LOC107067473 n=1 Tax=Polistes dominula TaxID=743375 RepID=A0ABM1IE81_POLDO|nr:PREDICTED: uncharacterized protein LOC107067473 [Polistes dominula]
MVSNTSWMILAIFLIIFANSGSALRCWDCSSHTSAMCGDPMNSTDHQVMFHVKECGRGMYNNNRPICRKTVLKDGGERIVIRSCAIPNIDENDITDGTCGSLAKNNQGITESCHICSTDLCNSASGLSTTLSLYIVGFIFIGYRFLIQSKIQLIK